MTKKMCGRVMMTKEQQLLQFRLQIMEQTIQQIQRSLREIQESLKRYRRAETLITKSTIQ